MCQIVGRKMEIIRYRMFFNPSETYIESEVLLGFANPKWMIKEVKLHPCLTDPSKSTPSKSPSKRGAEMDVPKQTRP